MCSISCTEVTVQKGDGIEYITDFDPSSVEETVGADAGIVALMSAEIGGSNAMEPLCVAASLGVPVLDCDGMGRAFPELQVGHVVCTFPHSSYRKNLISLL